MLLLIMEKWEYIKQIYFCFKEKNMRENLQEIVQPLLNWFDQNARILPWRDQPTPYRVWVSEIMLQQTRVEAVKPFYQRFMEALPDIQALAECEEEKLLKLWEGLGYYNRVRNMQIAARTVMSDYQGVLPDVYTELLKLKGIGSYTAGAIASIAYGKTAPAVDGNVLRVISRVTLNREDVLKQSVKRKIEQEMMNIMPVERPGAFNQALMELGAMVCVPNGAPHCEKCPLKDMCQARLKNVIEEIPVKKAKKPRRIEELTVFILRDGEHLAIHKRPKNGLLSGLYELPNTLGHLNQEEAIEWVKEKGFSPIRIKKLEPAKHIFSHVEWHMTAYLVLMEETENDSEYLLVEPSMTEKRYPIPAAFAAYSRYMEIKLGQEKYREEEN